jgi:F5/8 type C domain
MRKVALGLFGIVACSLAAIEVSVIGSPSLTGCGPLANDPSGDAAASGGSNDGGGGGQHDSATPPAGDSGSGSHDSGTSGSHDGGSGGSGDSGPGGSDDAGGGDAAQGGNDGAQAQCTPVTTWAEGAGLNNSTWSATATPTPTTDGNTGDAVTANAFDDNIATRWSSGQAQTSTPPLLEFTLNLGSVQSFDQVALFYPAAGDAGTTDFPYEYSIGVSASAGGPFTVVGTGTGGSPTVSCFAPQSAQFIQITETGTSGSWFSIYEMQVFSN